MADYAVITLDTTPPRVEFGSAGGTTAGEFFQIAYTSDEPLAWATLISASGQRLALDVAEPGVLSVALPPDIADGWATIEWADDVGNEDQAVPVRLTGAVVQPPAAPPPSQGYPRPDKRPMIRRRLTARSSIIVTSRSRRSEVERTRRLRVPLTVVARTQRRAELHREAHLAVTSRTLRRAKLLAVPGPVAVSSRATIRRRDDPTIEAFLLDLL